jgi:CRP/FNR family transcriptional regulator
MNLDDLEPASRALVLSRAKTGKLARGETAYAPGDRAASVYFVRSGRVKIVRSNAAGAEAIVGIRNAGDIFGELTWMEPQRVRTTSSVAIEPTTIDTLAADDVRALLESNADFARAFARGIARRLAKAEYELTELAGKSVPGRLVDVLGQLAAEHGVEEPDGTLRIGINLTHKDLADLIGTSRETLTKELSVLADVGLLRVGNRTVTLVQPRAFPFARRREPS